MQPYIKFIACDRFGRDVDAEIWYKDPCKAFHALSLAERAYFLLGQCIFMHYINKLYRSSSMPVVEEYENYLKSLIVETDVAAGRVADTDVLETTSICKTLMNANVFNKNYKLARPVDKVQITHVLFDSEFKSTIPQPCPAGFVVPFITWVNADTGIGVNTDEKNMIYADPVIPTYYICEDTKTIRVHAPCTRDNYSMGKSFQLDEQILTSPRMSEFPMLQFLAMTDLSGVDIESILAFIGGSCPHGDTALMVTNMHGLSYRLFRALFYAGKSQVERFGKAKCYYNTDDFVEAILEFVSYLHSKYDMAVPSRELLADIIEFRSEWRLSESSRKLVDYLRCEDVKTVSTECYKAFTNSPIGSISEYDIFSQSFIASQEAQEDDLDNPSDELPTEEEPDSGSDTTELDDASDADSMPDEGDEGADTPPEEPEQDDTLDQADDEMPSDETGDNDGDDGSEGTNDDTQPPENPPLNTSDKRGIEIKIMSPDDETTDSILFKEEMNTYLASLLKNPPASMSPQHVQLLTKLWKNWLYALDPQTTMKIVAMVTKLPVTLKRINTSGDPQ